jgi:hypothetical protein
MKIKKDIQVGDWLRLYGKVFADFDLRRQEGCAFVVCYPKQASPIKIDGLRKYFN